MAGRRRSLRNMKDESDSDEDTGEEEINLTDENESSDEEEELGDSEDDNKNLLLGSDEEIDDDDEAPDDIGFSTSKKKVLDDFMHAQSVLKKEKASSKHKRKQKEELFINQKKQKLAELEKTKLPDDILQAVSGKDINKKTKEKQRNSKITFDEEDDDDKDDDKDEVMLHKDVEEFIPLNSSKGLVVKSVKNKTINISDAAKDFKKNMLYGGRVKRIDALALARQRAKIKARYV